MQQLSIFGLTFRGLTLDQIMARTGVCRLIVTVNADFIVRANEGDERFATIINRSVSTFDGTWPYQVARRKFPELAIEKHSGSDLIYALADACVAEGRTLLIVGGSAESAAQAQDNLNRRYQRNFCLAWSPPFERYPYSDDFLKRFRSFVDQEKPLAVALCLGSPNQEYLGDDELERLSAAGVAYCIGAGGTVDFLAGTLKRAPRFIQITGLEGVWRLFAQPSLFRLKRLWRSVRMFRYV